MPTTDATPRRIVEVEEDGTPYDVLCQHGIHFGGYRCWVCHPELIASSAWLFSPEMDAAAAAFIKDDHANN